MNEFEKYQVNQSTENKKNNSPYLIGILCFIPLVGFFVGVVLVILGITKYKDRKLTFIGIGGILFSVIVYSSLYYVGFVSDFGNKAWEHHSQLQLNGLVKSIEFYKLENGKYPDQLSELGSDQDFISILDPTQEFKNGNSPYYNYKNLGTKYLLFSSGTDNIPNTKDDIYPQLKTNTNSGWVKKE